MVGIVADAKYYTLHDPAPRTVYLHAFADAPGRHHQFAIRAALPPTRIAADVRRAVQDVVRDITVRKVTTLDDQVNASLVNERLIVTLSTLFATLSATLAAVGLYGVLAFTVSRRTREIGIRMALGATPRDVGRFVAGSAARMVIVGILLAAPVAFWSGRVAEGLVTNLKASMTGPFAGAAVALVCATVLAAYVPTRRATRVDPAEALRHT